MWEKICFRDVFYYIRSIIKYSYALYYFGCMKTSGAAACLRRGVLNIYYNESNSVCLCVCLSVCLCVCAFIRPSISRSIRASRLLIKNLIFFYNFLIFLHRIWFISHLGVMQLPESFSFLQKKRCQRGTGDFIKNGSSRAFQRTTVWFSNVKQD